MFLEGVQVTTLPYFFTLPDLWGGKSLDVLVVSTNSCREPVPVLPIGACLVAEAAERSGHRVRFLDLMFSSDPLQELRRALGAYRPQVVGLSVRNLDNTTMEKPENFIPRLLPLTRAVREGGDAHLVLGGAAVGIAPEPLLRLTGADWAVVGEGDRAFPHLLAALSESRTPSQIPAVAWLDKGEYRPPLPALPSGDIFNFTNIIRWIDLKPYRDEGATYTLQSKRGCAFDCSYCPCPRIEGSGYRLAPPRDVAEEIRRLAASGIRDVEFVDTVFNAPRDHAMAICEAVAHDRPPVRLHTFELNPAFVDPPLLSAMKAAGFTAVGLTAESAAEEVLAGLGKNYGVDDLCRAAEALRNSPLPCLWIFMLGGPGETAETVRATLRFAREQLKETDVAFFAEGIRIYPGTSLEVRARTEGVLADGADLLEPAFYLSPGLDASELRRMVRGAVALDPRFVCFGMKSMRYLPAIRRFAGRLGISPPLWRHTARIRRTLGWVGIRERPE